MRLLERGVEKRQQLVAEFQVLANDVFVILAEAPGLLIVTVDYFVVPAERRQKTHLVRAHQQLAVAAPDKTADVATDKRLTGKTKRREHRNIQCERFPGAVRIAGPHRRVTLNAGVTGARDDVGPLLRTQTFESFVSGPRHQ